MRYGAQAATQPAAKALTLPVVMVDGADGNDLLRYALSCPQEATQTQTKKADSAKQGSGGGGGGWVWRRCRHRSSATLLLVHSQETWHSYHRLGKYNVRYKLATIGKKKALDVGRSGPMPARAEPALTRTRLAEPDSSDEEQERLLELGKQGK